MTIPGLPFVGHSSRGFNKLQIFRRSSWKVRIKDIGRVIIDEMKHKFCQQFLAERVSTSLLCSIQFPWTIYSWICITDVLTSSSTSWNYYLALILLIYRSISWSIPRYVVRHPCSMYRLWVLMLRCLILAARKMMVTMQQQTIAEQPFSFLLIFSSWVFRPSSGRSSY